MRSSTLLLAGPLAVSAQVLTTITGRVQTATISSGSEVLYTTTWTYSNPATNYLTLTDSEGVVTGQPTGTVPAGGQPEAVTSQPVLETIPAGLPTGVTYVPYNASGTLTSFQVSVGSSTTVVLGAGGAATDAATTGSGSGASESGSASGSGSSSEESGSSSGSDSEASSSDSAASASASESGNAASSVQVAGAGIGLLAFIAALL